jgi:hypothetical protein
MTKLFDKLFFYSHLLTPHQYAHLKHVHANRHYIKPTDRAWLAQLPARIGIS